MFCIAIKAIYPMSYLHICTGLFNATLYQQTLKLLDYPPTSQSLERVRALSICLFRFVLFIFSMHTCIDSARIVVASCCKEALQRPCAAEYIKQAADRYP